MRHPTRWARGLLSACRSSLASAVLTRAIPDITTGQGPVMVHASTVCLGARAVLIYGASGTGKSGLALELIGLGARLVADDRTVLTATADGVVACCPDSITGMIEARGIGVLRTDSVAQAPVVLCVDMGQLETTRMPPKRVLSVLGHDIPLFHKVARAYFPAALMQYLGQGIIID